MKSESVLARLNPQQLEAAQSDARVTKVEAGAGTGKTQMLMGRIEYLLEEDRDKTLFISFSNAASEEIQRRISDIFQTDDKLRYIDVKTCHALGNRLLLRNYNKVNFAKRPILAKDWELIDIFTQFCRDNNVKPPSQTFLKGCLGAEAYSQATNKHIDEDFVRKFGNVFMKKAVRRGRHIRPEQIEDPEDIRQTIEELREFRKRNGYYLFHDMVSMAMELPDSAFGELDFAHILVDEVQDLNHIQHQFINRLQSSSRSLTLVGDSNQCIFSFQGSQPQLFEKIEELYPNVKKYKLETNYRCDQPVLNLANQILKNELDSQIHLVPNQAKPGLGVQVYTDKENSIVSWINKILHDQEKEEKDYSEIAILYRAHSHTPELEMILSNSNIPYALEGRSFFDDPVVEDMLAYFRIYDDKPFSAAYESAWQKIIRHKKFLGKKTEEASLEAAKLSGTDILSFYGRAGSTMVPLSCRSESQKSLFRQLIMELKEAENIYKIKDWEGLSKFAFELSQESWIDRYASDHGLLYEAQEKATNFLEWISSLPEGKNPLDTIKEHQDKINKLRGTKSKEGVQIMTVHKSKGLEWNNVGIWNVGEKTFPLSFGDPREERRLCYVAVTRARKNLAIFKNEDSKNSLKKSKFSTGNEESRVQEEQENPILKYAEQAVNKLLDALL